MGFRFRKSIKLGPVRLNLSKSGVGYSIGGKGFRFTKKAGGGTRTTTSIPGTGISYVKESGSGKRASGRKTPPATSTQRNINPGVSSGYAAGGGANMNNNSEMPISEKAFTELLLCFLLGWIGAHKFYKKKIGAGILYAVTLGLLGIGWIGDAICLCIENFGKNKGNPLSKKQKYVPYIAGFLCVALFGGCNNMSAPAVTPTEPPETTNPSIVATIDDPTDPSEESTIFAEETTEPSSEPVAETTTPPIAEPTEVPTEEPTKEPTEATTEPQEETHTYVLNTNTRKFHYEWCSSVDNMKESNKKILVTTREDVISRGYQPCGRCNP